jgi:hypothetical protein
VGRGRVRSRTATNGRTRPGVRQETSAISTTRPLGGDLAVQRSLLANADDRTGESVLTRLQRTHGNVAVSNLLQPVVQREASVAPAPEASPPANAPAGMAWSSRFRPGGLSGPRSWGGMTGEHKLFKGDVLVVTAVGPSAGTNPALELEQKYGNRTTRVTVPGSVLGGSVEWTIPLDNVGSYSLTFDMHGQTASPPHTEHVEVNTSFDDFVASVSLANNLVEQKYTDAITHITRAADAYRDAFHDQEEDLHEMRRQERIAGDVILGLIFAGAGGAVGGWVGDLLRNRTTGLGSTGSAIVTDGGKDLAKYIVRSIPRIAGDSGSMPITAGDSTDRASGIQDPTAGGRGRESAAGVDPFAEMTRLWRAMEGEKKKLLQDIFDLGQAARKGHASAGVTQFPEEPVELVQQNQSLEMLTAEIPTDKRSYLRMLWHAWLRQYAWTVFRFRGLGDRWIYHAASTIDDPWPFDWARKRLAIAAAKCDESIEAWEHLYITPSREEAEQTARVENTRPQRRTGTPN